MKSKEKYFFANADDPSTNAPVHWSLNGLPAENMPDGILAHIECSSIFECSEQWKNQFREKMVFPEAFDRDVVAMGFVASKSYGPWVRPIEFLFTEAGGDYCIGNWIRIFLMRQDQSFYAEDVFWRD